MYCTTLFLLPQSKSSIFAHLSSHFHFSRECGLTPFKILGHHLFHLQFYGHIALSPLCCYLFYYKHIASQPFVLCIYAFLIGALSPSSFWGILPSASCAVIYVIRSTLLLSLLCCVVMHCYAGH